MGCRRVYHHKNPQRPPTTPDLARTRFSLLPLQPDVAAPSLGRGGYPGSLNETSRRPKPRSRTSAAGASRSLRRGRGGRESAAALAAARQPSRGSRCVPPNRNDAELDLGLAESGVAARNPQVAGESYLAA